MAGCDFTGSSTTEHCGNDYIQYITNDGVSALTVTDMTASSIELKPDNSVTTPSSHTLTITGNTVINRTDYSAVISQTFAPDHDIAVSIGANVSITAGGGGFGGVWIRNDTSGNISIDSAATVNTDTGAGITGVTNGGNVSLTNGGWVTSTANDGLNSTGLYAENGPNGESDSLVEVINNGTVSAYRAGIRAVNYDGLVTITNNDTVSSTAHQGLIAWSDTNDVIITNNGSATAYDSVALQAWAGGNVTVVNSGTLHAEDDPNLSASSYDKIGIQAFVLTAGTMSITNTATGIITAPDGTGISAESASGDIGIVNAGSITGGNGVEAVADDGAVTIDNSGSITGSNGWGAMLTGARLDNSGSISGTTYGVVFSGSGNRLTTAGSVSGGTAAVRYENGGNTLDILPTTAFSGVVDYNGTIDNTTNFGDGSYRIDASSYLGDQNNIGLSNSSQAVVLINADTTGTINVVEVAGVGHLAGQYTDSISEVLGGVLSLDIDRPHRASQSNGALAYAGEEKSGSAAAVQALGNGLATDEYGNLFWARVFGGGRDQSAHAGEPANTSYHYGFISGVDHQYEEGYRLGAFGGGGRVRSESDGNVASITGNTGFGGIYGATDLGGMNLNASLTLGAIESTSKRSINNGAETATGSFDGWYLSPEISLSKSQDIAPQWGLTQMVKARYTGAFYGSYDETGSSQNISYGARESHSIEARLQTDLTYHTNPSSGLDTALTLTGAIVGIQYLGSDTLHASLEGNEFTISDAADNTIGRAVLGAGFDTQISANASLYGSIEGALDTDMSRSYSGRMGLKVGF